jgi:O-6-methylguanine DNA methyltransferase
MGGRKDLFRPVARSAVVTVAGERLRVAWTHRGIAAVEPESLAAKNRMERRLKMRLVTAPCPPVIRTFLADAAHGQASDEPIDLTWARDFEREVLEACRRIPYGETRSYGWLAREARRPLAVRAAASVIARNPLWLLVPCHRVIYRDGRLGPYGGGARGQARKRALLAREGVHLDEPRAKHSVGSSRTQKA